MRRLFTARSAAAAAATLVSLSMTAHAQLNGYHGIYYVLGQNAQFTSDGHSYDVAKYAGGLGTYPQQTAPLAVYDPAVSKTFFLYGGTLPGQQSLQNMIGVYDHATGLLARPRAVRSVGGTNVHQNATLQIDGDGDHWVFAHTHGNTGSGNIYRSATPHSIDSFVDVTASSLPAALFPSGKLSYGNPDILPDGRVMEVHNIYGDGRSVHVATGTLSGGSIAWNESSIADTRLMDFGGHYALSRREGVRTGIVANWHEAGNLDRRTNLYYVESTDFGGTWAAANGTAISGPVTTVSNPALVHNYQATNELVYVKSLAYEADGKPVILFATVPDDTATPGHDAGPHVRADYADGLRKVQTARWNGSDWEIRQVTSTDHNYDHGELWIDDDGTWHVVGAFLPGPQEWGTGGDIGLWSSGDQGLTWTLTRQVTASESLNATYPRLVEGASPEFFALWADGDGYGSVSQSHLYFMTQDGRVYQMPGDFGSAEWAAPTLIPEPAAIGVLATGAVAIGRRSRRRR